MVNMAQDSAERQKQKAKEMLGISDERATEIFQKQPDRKQQKKKEMEQKREGESQEVEEETQANTCSECGKEFDSERGMKVHKGQVH